MRYAYIEVGHDNHHPKPMGCEFSTDCALCPFPDCIMKGSMRILERCEQPTVIRKLHRAYGWSAERICSVLHCSNEDYDLAMNFSIKAYQMAAVRHGE